jgi:phage terminase large subunit GpA-like protein
MVMHGRWVAKYPHRTRRGYHLSGLYRIMGKKRTYRTYLHEFVSDFLDAVKGGPELLQVWTNTFMAEVWEIEMDKLSIDPIYLRREAYGPELPKRVLVLTCAVDTQADRLEYLVIGWGLGEEVWAIETGRLMGNPFGMRIWKALDAVINKTWDHPLLGKLKPVVTVIDSGGQHDDQGFAEPVYKFVRPRQPREVGPGVYAIKGSSKNGAALVVNRRPKHGICLKMIGTIVAKLTVQSRLKLDDHGPRFIHFPIGHGFDEESFAQLGAEAAKRVKRRGYEVLEFYKLRPRNEMLDMFAYSFAAVEILNPDLMSIAVQAKAKEKEIEPEPLQPAVQSPQKVRPVPREFLRKTPKLHQPGFGFKRRFR